MNKSIKIVFTVMIFLGLAMLLIFSILAISDSKSEDLVSVIPATIFGASLFLGGITGFCTSVIVDKFTSAEK